MTTSTTTLTALQAYSERLYSAMLPTQSRPSAKCIPKPAILLPASAKMKRTASEMEKDSIDSPSSAEMPATPKGKRRSLTATQVPAPDLSAPPNKRRRSAKDQVRSQDSAGEEAEQGPKESYPDPRWMNEPAKYKHLRDHKFKYVSKITNKLLEDAEWRERARSYQDKMKKKTGNWVVLNRDLFPESQQVPPSVNPLEIMIDVIVNNGATTPEDKNKDPSISGCFIRLMRRLVKDSSLLDTIEHDLCKNIHDRERNPADGSVPQHESPVASHSGASEGAHSPTTILEPGSPNHELDTFTEVPQGGSVESPVDNRSFDKQETLDSPLSQSSRIGTALDTAIGSPQAFHNALSNSTGYTGPIMHSVRGYSSGLPGPLRNIGNISPGYVSRPPVNTMVSPRHRPSLHGHLSDPHTATSPGLPSPLRQNVTNTDEQESNPWNFANMTYASSQDPGFATIGPQHLYTSGPSQDAQYTDFQFPGDQSDIMFPFGLTQGPDSTTFILDPSQLDLWNNHHHQ